MCRLETRAQEVSIPGYIASEVIDELIMKDHMEYTLNIMDQTVALYKRNEQDLLEKVKVLQLSVDEYKVLIRLLEEKQLLTEEQLDACNHQNRKERRRAFWNGFKTGVPSGLALALLILLL